MSLRLAPMTEADYASWTETALQDYAQEYVDSSICDIDEARAVAEKSFADLLPDGRSTVDHLFLTAHDGPVAVAVGMIWVWLGEMYGAQSFIYDVVVRPEQRRRGYGRAILVAVEEELRGRGFSSIALNVFAANTAAIALYEGFGYQVVERSEQDGRVVALKMRHTF